MPYYCPYNKLGDPLKRSGVQGFEVLCRDASRCNGVHSEASELAPGLETLALELTRRIISYLWDLRAGGDVHQRWRPTGLFWGPHPQTPSVAEKDSSR